MKISISDLVVLTNPKHKNITEPSLVTYFGDAYAACWADYRMFYGARLPKRWRSKLHALRKWYKLRLSGSRILSAALRDKPIDDYDSIYGKLKAAPILNLKLGQEEMPTMVTKFTVEGSLVEKLAAYRKEHNQD